MKIALLASTFLPRIGGAEVVVHNLALALQAKGHDVSVITWWGLWRSVRGRVGYRVIPLLPVAFTNWNRDRWFEGKGSRWGMAWQIEVLQRVYGFDVWNIHMAYPAGFLAVPTLNRLGVPTVTTCHGDDIFDVPDVQYHLMGNPHIREALLDSMRRSAFLTAISQSVRNEYVKYHLPESRIMDVPNGVNYARIDGHPVDRQRVREQLGWSSDQQVILSVGRYHKQKGYDLIPEVIRRLPDRGKNKYRWCVVGSDTAEFKSHCDQARVGDRVECRPAFSAEKEDGGAFPPAKLIELYKAADVLVMPSYFESFGLVLVEAMAAGLPVCTTDAPGCRDVVTGGVNGLRAPVGDAGEMARCIQQVMEYQGLRANLIKNGRKFAKQLSWERIADRYVEVYRRAIGERVG